MILRLVSIVSLSLVINGCAIMHHTQVGEVDSDVVLNGERFEVLVSEFGFNFKEAGNAAKSFSRNKETRSSIQTVNNIIALFQMGPKTGNQVFDDRYADEIFGAIKKRCAKGKVSGLTSVRETAKYPVVSGEVVKIIGYCQKLRSRDA